MKRIVTIQDISCVGKCSLTVALPIISARGTEAAVLPTAVLSTHTMFTGYTFKDLTDQIAPIAEHWKKEKLGFDAIYTGYLGSFEQLDLVSSFFDDFKTEENVIFVDPVMGDNGSLYTGFTTEFARKMAELCGKADIIVPNMTEACAMTDSEYKTGPYTMDYLKDMLKKLADLGAKKAVITGASMKEGMTGVMAYDPAADDFFIYAHPMVAASYHGTGDIFASACVGALMKGKSLEQALALAASFTSRCIQVTYDSGKTQWYGVDFEAVIPELIELVNNK